MLKLLKDRTLAVESFIASRYSDASPVGALHPQDDRRSVQHVFSL